MKKYLTGRANLDFSPGPHTILFSGDNILVPGFFEFGPSDSADDFWTESAKSERTNNTQ